MEQTLEELSKALAHLDKARAPLAEREKTSDNRILVKMVDYAGLHVNSALCLLRRELGQDAEGEDSPEDEKGPLYKALFPGFVPPFQPDA